MKFIQDCAFAMFVVLCLIPPSQAANRYRVRDLGGTQTEPHDINDLGQVVGQSFMGGSWLRAFSWTSSGGTQDLGVLSGDNSSTAYGVNNLGQVVGHSSDYPNGEHAFLWTGAGGMQHLDQLPGGDNNNFASDINNIGQVVGSSGPYPNHRAFLWTTTTGAQDLGTLPGHFSSVPWAINDAGQIVGVSGEHTSSVPRAFLWTSSAGMQDLGVLPGGNYSTAWGINNLGQVVGRSGTAAGVRAFLWTSAGGMQDLGALPGYTDSVAYGINDVGQVVGQGGGAFIWNSAEGMKDLETLLDRSGTDWDLARALAINNLGQIVGDGWRPDGSAASFLLTPIPGDFNMDGDWDCADIDRLVGVIAAGTNDPGFDLTGDGTVDASDLTQWLSDAGAINLPSGSPYLPGDANLNGDVDGSDFGIWNANKFTSVAAWCSGDFDANGNVDGTDFGIWNANKFTSSSAASTVPEPQESLFIAAFAACLLATGLARVGEASTRKNRPDPASVGLRLDSYSENAHLPSVEEDVNHFERRRPRPKWNAACISASAMRLRSDNDSLGRRRRFGRW